MWPSLASTSLPVFALTAMVLPLSVLKKILLFRIGSAAIDHIAARDPLARWLGVRLVFPFHRGAGLGQVEREEVVRIGGDDVHRIVDDERRSLFPAVDAQSKVNRLSGDLLPFILVEFGIARGGIVLFRHQPLAVILGGAAEAADNSPALLFRGSRRGGGLSNGNRRCEPAPPWPPALRPAFTAE